MRNEVYTRRDAIIRTAVATLVAVSVSVVISLIATTAVFGLDMNATVTVSKVFTFGLLAAALVPASICPLMRYPTIIAVRDRDRAYAELRRLAQTDQLTGLFNRLGFNATAEQVINARDAATSVLMLDLDHFKDINDKFGHDFGDAALVHIAAIIRDMAANKRSVVGRRGGEEFVVLMPRVGHAEALAFAERVRAACAAAPLIHNGLTAVVSISIGVASQEGETPSLPVLINNADVALYRAKQAGRNCVVSARPERSLPTAA